MNASHTFRSCKFLIRPLQYYYLIFIPLSTSLLECKPLLIQADHTILELYELEKLIVILRKPALLKWLAL